MIYSDENIISCAEFDSPIEFVLIATIGRARNVIAKSKGARIDLASYATSSDFQIFRDKTSSLQDALFPMVEELRPLVANSVPLRNPVSEHYDPRFSEFTLVWRGAGGFKIIDKIERLLNEISPILVDAYESDYRERVEWLLSPVIALCNESMLQEKNIRYRSATRLKLFIGISIVYSVVSIAALYYKFLG